MKYQGSCQCGQVAFDVEGEIDSGLACNCSMCSRRASESGQATYKFNKHVIEHHFCPTCGIHTYGEANDPKGNPVAAVNLRVIEGLDLSKVPVHHYDGAAL